MIIIENKKDNTNISGSGVNIFKSGFSEENLDRHWTHGESDYSREYLSYTKEQSATSDTVLGYKNSIGQVIDMIQLKIIL